MSSRDNVTRAMTQDGSFRIIATTVDRTARAIATAQRADDLQARALTELLMAAILVRETSAPDKRVQVTLLSPSNGSLVAESRPDGSCRGFINPGHEAPNPEQTLFQVAYHRRDGNLHQSTVAVDPSIEVADALMLYLQTSVQIVSTVELCAAGDAGAIHGAGYAVQLLPGSNAEVMRTMTESLESREALLASSSANDLIERLAGKIAVTPLAASDLRFECGCSRDRVVATIAGLERSELAELTARNEAVEVNCDGCNRTYRVEPGELSALVTAGRS